MSGTAARAGATKTTKKATARATKKRAPAKRSPRNGSAAPEALAPAAPVRLGDVGRALWARITAQLEFTAEHELAILELACSQADDVASLERSLVDDGVIVVGSKGQPRLNAVVAELRQGRLALAKLLGELALPADDEEGEQPRTAQSRRAQKAANARWAKRPSGHLRRDVNKGDRG